MTKLLNNKDNNARITALKIIKETDWVGNVTHRTMGDALVAINLFQGTNSGWYAPSATRIKGMAGWFMINENGSLNFESRIIKKSNNEYIIEHLTTNGYGVFERKYNEEIN
jgi:hypothetical protein